MHRCFNVRHNPYVRFQCSQERMSTRVHCPGAMKRAIREDSFGPAFYIRLQKHLNEKRRQRAVEEEELERERERVLVRRWERRQRHSVEQPALGAAAAHPAGDSRGAEADRAEGGRSGWEQRGPPSAPGRLERGGRRGRGPGSRSGSSSSGGSSSPSSSGSSGSNTPGGWGGGAGWAASALGAVYVMHTSALWVWCSGVVVLHAVRTVCNSSMLHEREFVRPSDNGTAVAWLQLTAVVSAQLPAQFTLFRKAVQSLCVAWGAAPGGSGGRAGVLPCHVPRAVLATCRVSRVHGAARPVAPGRCPCAPLHAGLSRCRPRRWCRWWRRVGQRRGPEGPGGGAQGQEEQEEQKEQEVKIEEQVQEQQAEA